MTAPAAPPATTAPAAPAPESPGPTSLATTPRALWRRARGLLIALAVLLVAALALAAARSDAEHGRLDPRAADPRGSRAVAELLDDRGVSTRVVTTTAEAEAAAGPGTTVLVARPDLLTENQQRRLAGLDRHGRTVLVAPTGPAVGRLTPGTRADTAPSLRSVLRPDCALPAARRAGTADIGGIRYRTTTPGADRCYRDDGLPSLLRLPAADGPGDTVVLGSPDILFNEHLDEHGNASLALQLLGSRPHLVWYLPSLSDPAADTDERGFFDLVPSGWLWGTLQLTLAAVLAAFWRGRRFGRLVPERLPVAVRASETTEGRARLYHRTQARDRAASALRSATRSRLAPLLGLAPARAHTPEALLPAVAARLPEPGHDPTALLFGPPPADDAALVKLADHLDALEREVRGS